MTKHPCAEERVKKKEKRPSLRNVACGHWDLPKGQGLPCCSIRNEIASRKVLQG
jgi:hypothetical protein